MLCDWSTPSDMTFLLVQAQFEGLQLIFVPRETADFLLHQPIDYSVCKTSESTEKRCNTTVIMFNIHKYIQMIRFTQKWSSKKKKEVDMILLVVEFM